MNYPDWKQLRDQRLIWLVCKKGLFQVKVHHFGKVKTGTQVGSHNMPTVKCKRGMNEFLHAYRSASFVYPVVVAAIVLLFLSPLLLLSLLFCYCFLVIVVAIVLLLFSLLLLLLLLFCYWFLYCCCYCFVIAFSVVVAIVLLLPSLFCCYCYCCCFVLLLLLLLVLLSETGCLYVAVTVLELAM